jgi:hypothetical protein
LPIISVLSLNYWRDGFNEETIYGFVSMINYDMLFMSAGMVDNFYYDLQQNFVKKHLYYSKFGAISLIFKGFMIAITIPAVDVNEGQIFYFPLYGPTWMQNMFCLGSFYWINYVPLYMDGHLN